MPVTGPPFDLYQAMARRPKATARMIDNTFGTLALTGAAIPTLLATAAACKATSVARDVKHRFQVEAHKFNGEKINAPPTEEGVKSIPFFVQVHKKHYCFNMSETATVGEVKALAFFKQGQNALADLKASTRKCFGVFALQRHTGAHLSDERTLKSCGIQPNQTLVMTGKGIGGSSILEQIDAAESAMFHLKNAREMPGMQDLMRQQLTDVYNANVERLHALYRQAGIVPEEREERNCAVVNPVPIALQEAATGGAWCGDWVETPTDDSDGDGDGEGDVDMHEADSQTDSQAPVGEPLEESEMWRRAKQHPAHDPRIKKPGMQWIPDFVLEKAYCESDKNPNGKGQPYTLCGTDKQQLMGARLIDHSLSRLEGPHWDELLREIGIHFHCGPKQPDVIRPNSDGTVVRVLSCILNSKPVQCAKTVVQNVLNGDPQGGKSYEAVLDCWAKFFIHGCLPIYYVRNLGGLNDCNEACKDFENFNEEIKAFCLRLKLNQPTRFAWLDDSAIAKVQLTPRLMSDSKSNHDKRRVGLEVEFIDVASVDASWAAEVARENDASHKCVALKRPTVIVGLMNKASITKFMHTGCVLPEQYEVDLDGNGYKVNRGQLLQVFTGKKHDGKMRPAKITPFSLFFGIHNVQATFQQHGKRATAASSARDSHPGKAVLHSAYGPCCWDTSEPYDQGTNCKRGRVARLIDEIDTTTSENKRHVIGDLNFDSAEITQMANEALDKRKYDSWRKAVAQAANSKTQSGRLTTELDQAMRDLDILKAGGMPEESTSRRRDRDNAARAARCARRDAAGPSTAGPFTAADDHDSDSDGNDDDEVEIDCFPDGDDDDDDDDDASQVSMGSSASTMARRHAERQAKKIEAKEGQIVALQQDIEKLDESRVAFRDAEARAMNQCSGHISGMAAAAMYNVGITATTFGCMQRVKGGRVSTQTRVDKMPTPDAYNGLARWDGVAKEWRLLREPTKKAKKGSIKIKEAPVKRLGFFDMTSAANKNKFFTNWMVEHGHATRDEQGHIHPDEPVLPPNERGSYTIRPVWYEHDPKKGEQPEYQWVADMMNDYLKAKKMQTRRMHNSWARNSEMFSMALKELQSQRDHLKKVRRCAQGMIISGETRFTTSKDHLIADLFVRMGNGADELMNDVCAFNYAGERLSLYFRPENLDERLIENIIDNPDSFLQELRDYLAGDPTMHYSYTDPKTNEPKTKLCTEWLRRHYITPIRAELQRCVVRLPVSAAEMAAHASRAQAAKDLGQEPPPPPLGRIKFNEETKVARDAITDDQVGNAVLLKRLDFQKPTPQPRFMATLFTIIDAHRYAEDPDAMRPMPFVGMTKTAGGRAQRYMCHGHRSRIQVMVHTFDIFPNKRLGLAMCDAIQEGFRAAGFDEHERFGTNSSGCPGQWMDDWVDQVYVSTKDFVPLLQNALMSMDEWNRLLRKEQRDPLRFGESEAQHQARLKESPSECLERVIGGEVVECFREAVNVWAVQARSPTVNDMPYTDYPHLHKWLMAHVNRAPNVRVRALRHSNQTKSEDAIREYVATLCRQYLRAELTAYEQGEGGNPEVCSKFEEMVDQLDQQIEEQHLDADAKTANRDAIETQFLGKIPLPRYSAAHAPGGDLEARDIAEQAHYHEALRELLAGRDTISEQYEKLHGDGYAFNHIKNKRDSKHAWYTAGAQRMRAADEPTDGGPDRYLNYRAATITAWIKRVDHGECGGSRTRKRKDLAVGSEFTAEVGEVTDKARLTEFMKRAVEALNDHNRIRRVESSIAQKPPAAFRAKATTAGNLERARQRIEEVLDPLTGQDALTLVDQLPSALREWPVMVDLLEQAFEGTVMTGSKKAFSIGTAFKWAAVALGLTDFPEGDDRQWNLRKYVVQLESDAITAAQATVDADANAQIRIANRRQARQATNAAAIQAAAEAETSRRVRPRLAAGDGDDDQ